MKTCYLFWAAFIILLDISISQDVDVPCKETKHCQDLTNAPPTVVCREGFCKCLEDNGTAKNCVSMNTTTPLSEPQIERVTAALIGRVCSIDKDCDTTVINAFCNTTSRQCACKNGNVPSLDNQNCLPGIQYNNSGCEIPKQCLLSASNTTCNANGTCVCDVDYHWAFGACWATKGFGLNCSATPECSHVQEAVCNDQSICGCPASRVIDPTSKICLPIASKIQDECVESIQCTELMGEKGTCVNQKCQCHEHHHFSNDTSKCIPNLHIGADCQTDDQCLNGDDQEGGVKGSSGCFSNKCACAEGFENVNNKCEAVAQKSNEPSGGNRLGDVSAFVMALAYFILLSLVL